MREYEQAKGRVNRQRLAAAAAWRASTGTDMQRPPAERGGRCECMRGISGGYVLTLLCAACSIHIDVFGTLRGACKASGCTMWRRDIATAKNWSDTTVLTCQARSSASEASRPCRSAAAARLTAAPCRRSVARATTRTRTAADTSWTTRRSRAATAATTTTSRRSRASPLRIDSAPRHHFEPVGRGIRGVTPPPPGGTSCSGRKDAAPRRIALLRSYEQLSRRSPLSVSLQRILAPARRGPAPLAAAG